MKKFALILALVVTGLMGATQVNAQKFGHINSQELLAAMPEAQQAQTALLEEEKKLRKQLESLSNEYQMKMAQLQQNMNTMSELMKESEMQGLQSLEARITDFQMKAEKLLAKKEEELMTPVMQKAKDAVETVAKENGYTYVLDSATGVLITSPDSDDLMPLVKKKLGITG